MKRPSSPFALLGVALLIALSIVFPGTAHAAGPNELDLGTPFSAGLGGSAMIGIGGTTASGIYQYYDASGQPARLPAGASAFNSLNLLGTSTVSVSGGSLGRVYLGNTSTANVTGGSLDTLIAEDHASFSILGGSLTNLFTFGSSTIDLFGTGFTETLVGTSNGGSQYHLAGTLESGQALSATYNDNGGQLLFTNAAPVPEASSGAGLGLMLTFGFLIFLMRRRGDGGEVRKAATEGKWLSLRQRI